MQPALLKLGIRAVATLGALFGFSGLFFSLAVFVPAAIRSGSGVGVAFALFGLAFSSYLLHVGHLAWFRWSPLAVRHTLGTLAFALFVAMQGHGDHLRAVGPRELSPVIFLGSLWLLFLLYRWSVAYCCARLFPSAVVRPTAPTWKFVLAFLTLAAVLGLMWLSWSYSIGHRALP